MSPFHRRRVVRGLQLLDAPVVCLLLLPLPPLYRNVPPLYLVQLEPQLLLMVLTQPLQHGLVLLRLSRGLRGLLSLERLEPRRVLVLQRLFVGRAGSNERVLGKIGDPPADGDAHQRTNTHGYGYGMRLG